MIEAIALVTIALLGLVLPVALVVMVIVAFTRSTRIALLEARLNRLEYLLRTGGLADAYKPRPTTVGPFAETAAPPAAESVPAAAEESVAVVETTLPTSGVERRADGIAGLEMLLGRRVLGWIAVAALLLAAATFIKYAFDNGWIGPQGQLVLVLAFGGLLLLAGGQYARYGWRLFSEMLLSAGLLVVYLTAYASFGYYRLLTQEDGFVVLVVLVVEAAALAVVYRSWAIALAAVLGGLAVPLLVQSPTDQYVSLFTYLALVNAGTLGILLWRTWPALGLVALVGSQGLFALWYDAHFHPEKLVWALGFQAVLWLLYIGHFALEHLLRRRRAGAVEVAVLLGSLVLGFGLTARLLSPEHKPWLGTLAMLLACCYTALAHGGYRLNRRPDPVVLTMLGMAVGLVATCAALEAKAQWVSVGWAAMALALCWFGLRAEIPTLRAFAGALALMALGRLVLVDGWYRHTEPYWPIANGYALPALATVGCVLAGARLSWPRGGKLSPEENQLFVLAGVLAALALCGVVSVDLHRWFLFQQQYVATEEARAWRWAGDVAVSVWWGVYATVLLAVGFRARRSLARWMGLVLYGATVLKVVGYDMASVNELYRILVLVALSLLLGLAAWGYQRAARKWMSGEWLP